jgi:hypothetical protein
VYRADVADGASPLRISPLTHVLHRNLVINADFHHPSCGSIGFDLDDESSQYNITSNVVLYGGVKTFDGMDRYVARNLLVYSTANPRAGGACYLALQAMRNRSSAHTRFVENTCVMRASAGGHPYNCNAGPAPFYNKSYRVTLRDNSFIYPDADTAPDWASSGACSCWPDPKVAGPCPYHTLADWQADGLDVGSTVSLKLPDADLLQRARSLLGLAQQQ